MKLKRFIKDWVYPIVTAIIIAMLINRFVLFKIYVPSESMKQTIMVGDQLFVTKVYNTEKIKRGDILVFYSEELGDLLIKRVIGLPGEKVEIKDDGSVFINGSKIEEPYVKYNQSRTGSFNVPKDHFLFLGDNRANSKDSRYWKNPYISKDEIKGKARIIVFPFSRFGVVK
jgi:signal peptidase I